MVIGAAHWPTITVTQAGLIGTVALIVIHLLDILASADDVPGNSPREWLIRLSQWRSLNYWHSANIDAAKAAGEYHVWLKGFQYLPMTGAIVPFLLSALIGHFFHPWSTPPLPLGWWGLISVLSIGLLISVVSYYASGTKTEPAQRLGQRLVVWIATAGILAGGLLWPVS